MAELVEAIKILGDQQATMAELLKTICAEQREQRAAMVRLAALIEARGGGGNYRPN